MSKAVPLPWASLGLLHGIQSIEIKYFQEYVFVELFDRCLSPILACTALVSDSKIWERGVEVTLDGLL